MSNDKTKYLGPPPNPDQPQRITPDFVRALNEPFLNYLLDNGVIVLAIAMLGAIGSKRVMFEFQDKHYDYRAEYAGNGHTGLYYFNPKVDVNKVHKEIYPEVYAK